MLRANRPILAFFDSIKALRVRQLALILKSGYDPNLMVNARGQNGLQFMINYFGATDAHYRLQAPINKSAYLSIAKLLLDSGLDPNAMDLLTDETVLFDAIRYNDREMVALLLNYVDPALRNKNGETALMCAARFGSKQVTRLILDHLRHLEMDGYFLRQRNRFGLTPLEIARTENLEAARVLTKHLIAYGHAHPAAGGVLARSVSHHHLAANYGAYGAPEAARRRHRPHPVELLADPVVDCFSPSDYDDEDFVEPAKAAPRPVRRPAAAAAVGYPYYDPKAAEFSQYLLDQQVAMDSGEGGAGRAYAAGPSGHRASAAAVARTLSEEEDYSGGGVAGGPLIRSRSCMLGPGSKGANYGGVASGNKKSAGCESTGGGGKMSAGWQEQSSGGGAVQ